MLYTHHKFGGWGVILYQYPVHCAITTSCNNSKTMIIHVCQHFAQIHGCLAFLFFVLFQPVDVRFIEYMPFDGKILNYENNMQTRNWNSRILIYFMNVLLGNKWNFKKFVSYQEMLNIIQEKWPTVERLRDQANDTSKVVKNILFFKKSISNAI